jgi:hypothetical protein
MGITAEVSRAAAEGVIPAEVADIRVEADSLRVENAGRTRGRLRLMTSPSSTRCSIG